MFMCDDFGSRHRLFFIIYIISILYITSETVEKPQNTHFEFCNYLILIHSNFTKMEHLDFFDSLSSNVKNSRVSRVYVTTSM